MNQVKPNSVLRASGFSVVEVMIALVAGLIVAGAVLAFTVSSVRSNSEYINATRLTQELRTSMDYIGRELRRAGYDQRSLGQLARVETSTEVSDFSPIFITTAAPGACMVYAYDREPGTPGNLDPANGELRGIRLRTTGGVGVLEAATSDAANPTVTCGAAMADYTTYPASCVGNWCPLSDHRVLDITALTITDNSPAVIQGSPRNSLPMRIREFEIVLSGRLVGVPEVVRDVRSRVRVRADCLRAGATSALVVAACSTVPAP